MRAILGAALLGVAFGAAQAQEAVTVSMEDDFGNAVFAVESAILDQGLVIDSISHVGEMLNRTSAEVGGEPIFSSAQVFNFCSATVSREVMEVDPGNIAHCPYGIFVYELATSPGEIVIGYRSHAEDSMAPVDAMLDGVLREAAGE